MKTNFTTTPALKWQASDNSERFYISGQTQTAGTGFDEWRFSNLFGYTSFYNSGIESMRITDTGNLGLGVTNPSEKMEVVGNVKATAFISTSDQRLKTDIQKITGLESILKLNGYKYRWIKDGTPDGGVIAQEVEKVFPDAVKTDQVSGFKAVKYNYLIAPLIESIKELFGITSANQREIATLNKKIESLNQQIDQTKKENQSIKDYLCSQNKKAAICKNKNDSNFESKHEK